MSNNNSKVFEIIDGDRDRMSVDMSSDGETWVTCTDDGDDESACVGLSRAQVAELVCFLARGLAETSKDS